MAPNPDYWWFDEMAIQRGLGSLVALSELVVSGEGKGTEDQLGRSLRRKRRIKTVEVVRLAEHLRVPVRVILNKLGFDVEDPRANIVGRVNGGGFVIPSTELIGSVAAPDYIDTLVALIMDTVGSPLAGWHDCLVFYVPRTEASPDTEGQLSVIQIKERKTPILGYVREAGGGKEKYAEPMGNQERIATKQVVWSSPIRWMSFP